MNMDEKKTKIFNQVVNIITDAMSLEIEDGHITVDTNLSQDLNAESMDVVEIVAELEEKYDGEIEVEDLTQFAKVGDIVDYIYTNLDQT